MNAAANFCARRMFASATATRRPDGDLAAEEVTPLPCRPTPMPPMPMRSLAPKRPSAANTPCGIRYGAATPAAANAAPCRRNSRRETVVYVLLDFFIRLALRWGS